MPFPWVLFRKWTWLETELAYCNVAGRYVNHNASGTPGLTATFSNVEIATPDLPVVNDYESDWKEEFLQAETS